MFGQTFYYSSIKNYISVFGALFNDISIQRFDRDGNVIVGQLIKVPISFAPKQKWLVRLVTDPNAGATSDDGSPVQRQIEIQLPRMGFELGTMRYDPTRKLPSINKSVVKDAGTNKTLTRVYNPIPFIFPFELTIGSKNIEDIFQIVEQIVPYFKPTFTVTINETSLPISKDITIQMMSTVVPEISPYGEFKDSKILLATLNFELYGYLYGPAVRQKIITEADIRMFATSGIISDNQDIEDWNYSPSGLLPVGGVELVTTPDPLDAAPDSDFGFIVTKQDVNQ